MVSVPNTQQLPLFGLDKRCTKCGVVAPLQAYYRDTQKRDGLSSHCRDCINKRVKVYNAGRREERASYNRAYYAANREAMRAAQDAYYQENRERLQEAMARYRTEHWRALSASRRTYALAHPERERAWGRAKAARRLARELGAEGTYTRHDVDALYARQGGLCAYCGASILTAYHVDHVVPLSRGGSNWPANLALACPLCNMRKHDKTIEEYADWRARRGI